MEGHMTTPARDAFDYALDCERRGDTQAALSAYLDALDRAPEDMEIAYRTATALLRAGHLDEAASQLRRIVFVEPDHLPARANLGSCQFLLGDLANAESNFREVLSAAPDNHNALFGLATVCLKQDKPDAALVPAQRLMELLPENAPALTLYAQASARDPQASRAAAAFRKALTIDRSYTPALIGLAELSIRRKRYDEALELAEKALKLAPRTADPHRLLAEACQASGDLNRARKHYAEALSMPGDDKFGLLVALSGIHRKLGEASPALIHAYEAWQKEPGRKEAGNALGAALKSLGYANEARSVLTAVAQKRPLDIELTRKIATLAHEAGNTASLLPRSGTRSAGNTPDMPSADGSDEIQEPQEEPDQDETP